MNYMLVISVEMPSVALDIYSGGELQNQYLIWVRIAQTILPSAF